MRDEAAGKVTVTNSPATERTSFIRATDDLFPSHRAVKSATGAAEKATAYVTKYGRAFGGAGVELSSGTVSESPAGYTVDFTPDLPGAAGLRQQAPRPRRPSGRPDLGGRLRRAGHRRRDHTGVGRGGRGREGQKLVKAAPAGGRDAAKVSGDLTVSKADLSIYRMGAIQGVEGRNLLAWVIEVTDGKQVRETVVLDAATGKPVNRYSMIAHDLDRELIEAYDGDEPRETVWLEGDDWPVSRAGGELDEDQQNEVQGTGEAYWFFKNSFGRDSYDDEGSTMVTVNNDPSIQCPNANWNGISTNYCSGVSSDDTVAHEWGHAYTEYTSGLLYQWQPGAMNEAYSDIWGETVDMLNERYNEIPDVPRAVGDCSKYSLGIAISIVAPAEIAGDCVAVKASGGPDFPATRPR